VVETDGQPDGRMDGWTESHVKSRTGWGREDKNGLPEHECCPREASYKRS
jgi:hypothetical protein